MASSDASQVIVFPLHDDIDSDGWLRCASCDRRLAYPKAWLATYEIQRPTAVCRDCVGGFLPMPVRR